MKRPPEMSAAAFAAALKARGLVQTLLWIRDTTGAVPNIHWGCLYRNGKIARRATLARVIRDRDMEIAKRAAKAQPTGDVLRQWDDT